MSKSKNASSQVNITSDDFEGTLNDLRGVSNLLSSMALSADFGTSKDDKHSYLLLSQNLAVSIDEIETIKNSLFPKED